MGGNIWQKYGGATICVPAIIVLTAALGVRYGLLESGLLPRDCAGFGEPACALKWLVVQSFLDQRLGWVSLACGVIAFVGGQRLPAWLGWLTGVAGLVLYSFDYAAVGAMLSLLVLARTTGEGRAGQKQSDRQPADRLGIGGLR